ncbi:pirin family protein [Streptomyces sp. NPDC050743]|uniref:pirin family protein n=1 Tax=Streptomyces sp. NPDC050743 TaxID=3365634 RepID=UPI0037BC48F5
MEVPQGAAQRSVVRIERKMHFGPDTQVDDRNVIITPLRPELTDPFLLLSEDWFSSPGFEWHPHRGVETVTLVLDGVLEHGDNIGHAGALTTGDVQWMTAGRGIIHRELAFRNERAHTLQLWVNLPREMKMVDTRYQDLLADRRPVVETDGARIDLVSGEVGGVQGPALNNWPISGAVITLEPGRCLNHLLPGRDRAFLHVLSGTVTIAGRLVRAGETAWSDPLSQASLSTITLETADGDEFSVVMVYSGEPIGQPVVMGGPFVMNSANEIEQAFRDFQSGRFGGIPNQARLQYR